MICETSSRLTVRPASSPRTETLICSSSSIARRSHVPWLDLELLGDLDARLEADRDVVGDVRATDRQHPVWNGEPSWKRARSIVPAPMSATADAELLLGLGQDRLGRRERVDHELVDLDPGRGDALGQVLDRGRRRRDDVGLDLEPQRAHPERVLDALLAVDREAAPLDVEDVAVGRDRDGAGDLDRAVDVLAGDLAMVRVTATWPRELRLSTCWPPTPTKAGRSSSRQPLGALDRVAIERTVWSMLMTTPFLRPEAGTVPWPMIVSRPSRLTSPMRRRPCSCRRRCRRGPLLVPPFVRLR
jgi:hypothetical protein